MQLVSATNQLQFLPNGGTNKSITVNTANPVNSTVITIPDPGASTDTFALVGKSQTFTGSTTFNNGDLTTQGIVCKSVSSFSVANNTSAIHTYIDGSHSTFYDKGTSDMGGHIFRNNNGATVLCSLQSTGATFPFGIQGLSSAPASGQIGEFVRSYNGAYNYTTSNNPVSALNITLPSAGVWLISAMGVFICTSGTHVAQYMCISTASGTFSGALAGDNYSLGSATTTSMTLTIPSYYVVTTASTIFYLNVQANFSGIEEVACRLSAVRIC